MDLTVVDATACSPGLGGTTSFVGRRGRDFHKFTAIFATFMVNLICHRGDETESSCLELLHSGSDAAAGLQRDLSEYSLHIMHSPGDWRNTATAHWLLQ
eukprot:6189217-Pleurochrysis_carterae.AAC.2